MIEEIEQYLAILPARECVFGAGQTIFHLGDPVAVVHFVKEGSIQLSRYQDDGAVLTLQRAGRGAILAEASLYSDSYHCNAVAMRPTRSLAFVKADLREALLRMPQFSEAWMKYLAKELQKARLQAEILSLKTVAQRLDAWAAWHDGKFPHKGDWRNLADQIGVSPEALYREMAKRRASE